MQFTGILARKQGDRAAPGTLARDAPIGPAFEHAVNSRFTPAWLPVNVLNRGQRSLQQTTLLHADKPLWRSAKNNRALMAPAVGIAMFVGLTVQ